MPVEGGSAGALPPGSTIGILGGGQLGRMLALAAAPLGFRCHIYCPDDESPAFDVSAAKTVAGYDNAAALENFARAVNVVTYEFENVPVAAVERLGAIVPVRPGAKALAISQDRLTEKSFLGGLGIATARFEAVGSSAELDAASSMLALPAILKTRRFGYDGKGQIGVREGEASAALFEAIGGVAAILEERVPFTRELSIIAVRGVAGEIARYDISENEHRAGILHSSTVPVALDDGLLAEAGRVAEKLLEALEYVGVIGIEFFYVADASGGRLVVNEFAPRVHNSGHWTGDACEVSQFENHIRAVAGWPLGPTRRRSNVVMTNLIGDEVEDWPTLAADPQARLHLYGKHEARAGRKMGHVNRLTPLR